MDVMLVDYPTIKRLEARAFPKYVEKRVVHQFSTSAAHYERTPSGRHVQLWDYEGWKTALPEASTLVVQSKNEDVVITVYFICRTALQMQNIRHSIQELIGELG